MNMSSAVRNQFRAALFASAAAAFAAVPTAEAAVVYVNLTVSPLAIANTIDGVYLNVVTGATGASAAAVPGWDFNAYNNATGLTFYGAASPAGILATGTAGTTAVAQALALNSVISATPATGFYNQYQTTGVSFQTAGLRYVGLRFLNDATNTTNYGWALISSGAGTSTNLGFPAAILGYAYENTGLAILAGQVPEPSTAAMFGVAVAGALGVGAARRRRRPS